MKKRIKIKIKVIKEVEEIFPEYRPTIGEIYDAEYTPRHKQKYGNNHCGSGNAAFCVIDVCGKRIVLRSGEFEIVGGVEDGAENH